MNTRRIQHEAEMGIPWPNRSLSAAGQCLVLPLLVTSCHFLLVFLVAYVAWLTRTT